MIRVARCAVSVRYAPWLRDPEINLGIDVGDGVEVWDRGVTGDDILAAGRQWPGGCTCTVWMLKWRSVYTMCRFDHLFSNAEGATTMTTIKLVTMRAQVTSDTRTMLPRDAGNLPRTT